MSFTAGPPITLAVARFEDIVTRGLEALVDEDPNLELLTAGVPFQHFAATIRAKRPDVAIVNLAALNSPSELRELCDRFPDTHVVVLGDNPTADQCRQVMGFGATACLAKTTDARDLLHAIHLASRGMRVLPARGNRRPEASGPTPLTAREADVLDLLQTGRSNAEIAGVLSVGVETVRTHVRNIYRKLGVRSRRDLRSR